MSLHDTSKQGNDPSPALLRRPPLPWGEGGERSEPGEGYRPKFSKQISRARKSVGRRNDSVGLTNTRDGILSFQRGANALDEDDGIGTNGFASSHAIKPFARFRLHAHLADADLQRPRHLFSHL